ncbi:MAG: CHASE4 domain-containing protein, partial [Bacteroidota bacterium]
MRLALLVVAIFGFATATLLLVQRMQRQSMADLLESETRERTAMLDNVINLMSQSLRDFAQDYAQWDDMVQFIQRPRPEWAAINLDASLDNFKLSAAWVLRTDGS